MSPARKNVPKEELESSGFVDFEEAARLTDPAVSVLLEQGVPTS